MAGMAETLRRAVARHDEARRLWRRAILGSSQGTATGEDVRRAVGALREAQAVLLAAKVKARRVAAVDSAAARRASGGRPAGRLRRRAACPPTRASAREASSSTTRSPSRSDPP